MLDENKQVKGFIVLEQLLSSIIAGEIKKVDLAEKALVKQFRKVALGTHLGRLSRILKTDSFTAVFDEHNHGVLVGVLTQTDLYDFIRNDEEAADFKKRLSIIKK